MKKSAKKLIIIAGSLLTIALAVLFFFPYLFRVSFIENVLHLELPKSSKILEYKIDFDFNLWGSTDFSSKIEITQETYDTWKAEGHFVVIGNDNALFFIDNDETSRFMVDNGGLMPLNLRDSEELLFRVMQQRVYPLSPTIQTYLNNNVFIFIGSSKRGSFSYAVKESTEKYYLYVISWYSY